MNTVWVFISGLFFGGISGIIAVFVWLEIKLQNRGEDNDIS